MIHRLSVVGALTAAAWGCGPSAPDALTSVGPPFDGQAALDLVRRQVGFGPRIPGTPGHSAQADWMTARLDSLADALAVDSFTHVAASGDTLPLVNLLARFRPEEPRRVLLLTHWDTRPTSDQADDPALRERPVPGANDGGSGTAVLLVLAGLLSSEAPPLGVDLLFVDGEDYGPGTEDMFLGARRFARTLPPDGRPVYGVLLDLVGDADPSFPVEAYSAERAPVVVRKVWRVAERLGYGAYFPDRVGPRLQDDHLPLNDAGIPTADVIDFSYGPGNAYWHTPEDTADKVSAATLEMVGRVVTALVYSGG